MASKVRYWVTFNEPWIISILGYSTGLFAPGHTSDRSISPIGDSTREPWQVGHNVLLAHGTAVNIFREEFEPTHGGVIGIALNGDYGYPWDASEPLDIEACERKLEFSIGWFADPIYKGDYPTCMREQLGDRLPHWTADEIALVKGSNDFFGMNHYCSSYIKHLTCPPDPADFQGNLESLLQNRQGEWIGPETQSPWLRPHPPGFRALLNWISDRYDKPIIYVTENGVSVKGENDMPVDEILDDEARCEYFRGYIRTMAEARGIDGVDVRGYMAWSLME